MQGNEEEKILLNVGLNADEANQGLDQLKQKINNVSQQDLGTSSVQSYKLQIRQLTAELQKIAQVQGLNSAAFRQGARELAELKEKAKDFKTTIDAFDPSNKLRGLATIAKGGAVALEGAAGAMALFGVKGEKAEEVLMRLQGVMALSHAIHSIHEVTVGWQAFINMLGLAQEKAKAVSIIPPSAPGQAAEGGAVAANEAETASVEQLTAAQLELNAATTAGVEANAANATSQEALAVTEEGTAVASQTLGLALKGIGIGLIIAAIAYLISNWKEVKETFLDLFPVLKQTGSAFTDFKNDIMGLGSVVLHVLKSPIDEAITAIKILVDVVKGDFKGAVNDFKAGVQQQMDDWNVVANFKSGKAKGEAKDAEEAATKRIQAEIDANERIIKERQALGKNTFNLEVKTQQLKNELLKKEAEEDEKKKKELLDGESQITVLQNQEIKKRNDEAEKLRKEAAAKAAALKKQELDKLKTGNEEASKVIQAGINSQRDIELSNAQFKYDRLIAIAQKYNQDYSKLTQAAKIEEALINKKYDEQIADYLDKVNDDSLSEFDKKRKEINRAIAEQMKNANELEKQQLAASRNFQLSQVNKEESATYDADNADNNVLNAENSNRAALKKPDSAQVKFNKEQAIRDARLAAIEANYKKEQALAGDNVQKLMDIEYKYNKDKGDLEEENAKAAIELTQAEKDAKLSMLDEVSQGLNAASEIAGQSTAAGKALAVASTTISTYLSAQKAYESLIGTPYVGPVIAPIAAGVAVAAGLANVKKILSVKTPGGSAGSTNTPTYTAPTINSTVLNQAQQGVQNVNVVNQDQNKKQNDVRAYVVESDISNKQQRAQYLDRLSTI